MLPVRSGMVSMEAYAKWVARPSVIGGEGENSVLSGSGVDVSLGGMRTGLVLQMF